MKATVKNPPVIKPIYGTQHYAATAAIIANLPHAFDSLMKVSEGGGTVSNLSYREVAAAEAIQKFSADSSRFKPKKFALTCGLAPHRAELLSHEDHDLVMGIWMPVANGKKEAA